MSNQLQDDIRTLRETGHKAIAAQYERMAKALRIIHTWAVCDYGLGLTLTPKDTEELTEAALRRFE